MPVNTKGIQDLRSRLQQQDIDKIMYAVTDEITARLIAKVRKKTPVGVYPHRVGGTLRRSWTHSKTNKSGNVYRVEVINPMEYASYVEYGHRTVNHEGWVEGQFMLTTSETELKQELPRVIENKVQKMLEGAINGKR